MSQSLKEALERLLRSDPYIIETTDDDLREAVLNDAADPTVREQAAAILQARAALSAQQGAQEPMPAHAFELTHPNGDQELVYAAYVSRFEHEIVGAEMIPLYAHPATKAQEALIAAAIHYPDCWDTAAYPYIDDALSAVFDHFKCSECQPAKELSDEQILAFRNSIVTGDGWDGDQFDLAFARKLIAGSK